jgi:hypothetical protein
MTMEHRPGKGKVALGAIGERTKWDENSDERALDGVNFVDLWLAENPAGKEEELAGGISARKVASAISPENYFGPFAAEAKAINEGIKKYGSLEAFERATAHVDYFADSHTVEPVRLPSRPKNAGVFVSHDGPSGVQRLKVESTVSRTFGVSDETIQNRTARLDVSKATDYLKAEQPFKPVVVEAAKQETCIAPVKPSKRVRLGDDFDF